MFAQTQVAISKRLSKSLDQLAEQMHYASVSLYWVTLGPDGRRHEVVMRGGKDVAALFANKFDPFITMTNYALKDRIPNNIAQPRREQSQPKKLKMDVLLIANPNAAEWRAQITSIMHTALTAGSIIKEGDKVPWGSLDARLEAANKRISGWPALSVGYNQYSCYTKEDARAVMAARQQIRVDDKIACGPIGLPPHLQGILMEP